MTAFGFPKFNLQPLPGLAFGTKKFGPFLFE